MSEAQRLPESLRARGADAAWLLGFARRRRPRAPDVDVIDTRRWGAEKRAVAALVWARRVSTEALSVEVAQELREVARELREVAPRDTDLGAGIDEALARLEEDEVAHVELARRTLARIDAAHAPAPIEEGPRTDPSEPSEVRFMRLVVTGLAVCESVSAARFEGVLARTDLAQFRAPIALFLRDEKAHGELGFALVRTAIDRLDARVGRGAGQELVAAELRSTFAELDVTIGRDQLRRGGVERPGAQPRRNPGVVSPLVDAWQFYGAIRRRILPRLDRLGLAATAAWDARHGAR